MKSLKSEDDEREARGGWSNWGGGRLSIVSMGTVFVRLVLVGLREQKRGVGKG